MMYGSQMLCEIKLLRVDRAEKKKKRLFKDVHGGYL